MTRARTYSKANRTAQWFEAKFSRTTMPTIDKLLLHTTETGGWPGYDGGASAPTITYNPWLAEGQRWRQHNYLDRSARALRDPSSTVVRENQDRVVQVEIICYCDPKLYAKYGKGVNALPASFYEDMGAFLAFLHTEWGVPLVRAPRWATFPPPESIRMSGPTYDAFKGVLGHQHASGNTHGDPGMTNAQVDRILAVAKRLTAPPKPPAKPTPGGDMSAAELNTIIAKIDAVSGHLQKNNAQNRAGLFKDIATLLANIEGAQSDEIKAHIAAIDAENDKAVAAATAKLTELEAEVEKLRTELADDAPKA